VAFRFKQSPTKVHLWNVLLDGRFYPSPGCPAQQGSAAAKLSHLTAPHDDKSSSTAQPCGVSTPRQYEFHREIYNRHFGKRNDVGFLQAALIAVTPRAAIWLPRYSEKCPRQKSNLILNHRRTACRLNGRIRRLYRGDGSATGVLTAEITGVAR